MPHHLKQRSVGFLEFVISYPFSTHVDVQLSWPLPCTSQEHLIVAALTPGRLCSVLHPFTRHLLSIRYRPGSILGSRYKGDKMRSLPSGVTV